MKILKRLGMAVILGIIVYIILLLSNCMGGKLTSIAITPDTATAGIGKTANFTATGAYSDGTTADLTSQVAWASDNAAVATINSATGIATGVTVGNANISATFNGMTSSPASLKIVAELSGINISPQAPSTPQGVPVAFTATGAYTDGTNADITSQVAWASSDSAIAVLDASGIASAVAQGSTAITASLNGISSGSTTLTVTEPLNTEPILTAIAITPVPASVIKGLTIKFTATGTYNNGKTADITREVAWSSGNDRIAKINRATGVATGITVGSTTISASIKDIASPAANLEVAAATLTGISIAPEATSSSQGVPVTFTATGTYSNKTTGNISASVKWVSSNVAVATIDKTGLATGKSVGSSNISASSGAINSNTAVLSVKPPPPAAPVGVSVVSSRGQVTLSWLPVTGASSYNLYWEMTPGVTNASKKIAGVTTPYGHSGLTDGKTYYYRVSAENESGETLSAEIVGVPEIGMLGKFFPTGSMSVARQAHTATLLPNGKVLVAGGLSGANLSGSSEIYDPATGKFSATGNMDTGRKTHTATLLPNGKVLIIGGVREETPLETAEIYDPDTGKFRPTGSMSVARQSHTVTLLHNGKVLVTGGTDGSGALDSAEVYDPATGKFTATGSLTTARTSHVATLLASGKVLVTGGQGRSDHLASAEIYDPAKGSFSATGSIGMARQAHIAILLPSGKVLIAGGFSGKNALATSALFDPVTGTFSPSGSMATGRWWPTATLLFNGKVLVIGGSSMTSILSSAEIYNPVTGKFTATGSMARARTSHTATRLQNGHVLVPGGISGTNNPNSAEVFQ